ncbi:hypothetical protein B566_EDAN004297 [Ephemera danica]|nr:hypothetical protein B566_EDAN004297 [Ephemera danica]
MYQFSRDVTRQFGKQGYHVDAYQSTRGSTSALGSLAQLLSNTPEALRLRQLVIDRQTPCFEPASSSWATASKLLDAKFSLNEDQRAAIQCVFQSRDFVLIQGLPGTGKTATLVALVVALTAQNLSVLVTSHTNAAVDNLLRQVKTRGLSMLRLGPRCHEDLQQYGEEKLRDQAQTPEHLQALFDATLVVGVTCTTAAQHWVLRRRKFDVCLIDEATQVPLPATVAPLLSAKRFVLVGDPRQLQPVVVNQRAKELGMGETMFERLQSCSEAIATLGLQYRMNRVLCELANNLTYDGLLRCANEDVANATLKLTSKLPEATLSKFPWLARALSCEIEHSALFLDVGRSSTEDSEGTSKREASIVKALVHFFLQCGVPGDQVGVMSPFRAQVQLLHSMLGSRPGLEVSTVDQFQGRDKLVAVLSCVKSFPEEQQEPKERDGILNDPKRLTVAVTRSRVKLLIVGDAQSLSGAYDPCRRLLGALGPKRVITLRLS